MIQRSDMMRTHHSIASGSISMDSPMSKSREMKIRGIQFDDEDGSKKKGLIMPEYISTPTPEDKYFCHQDSASDSK